MNKFWIRDDLAASAFDPVLRAVQSKLPAAPSRVRIYANDPRADHDVANFQRMVERDRSWREALDRVSPDGADYEQFGEEQQAYFGSDRR